MKTLGIIFGLEIILKFILIKNKKNKAYWLFNNLKVIKFYHYPKIVEVHGQKLYLYGSKTIDKRGKMEFLIIVSFKKPEQAMVYFKQRWQIEMLFRGLKVADSI